MEENKNITTEQAKEDQELQKSLDEVNMKITEESKRVEEEDKKVPVKKVQQGEDFPYMVELYDILGSNSKRRYSFGVKRVVENGNVYLINETYKFKEMEPEDSSQYRIYKQAECENKIQDLRNELQNIKDGKSNKNAKSILSQVKKFENFKRSLELSEKGTGSYLIFDQDSKGGKPTYMFDRHGNMRFPVFKNADISTMYVKSEARIQLASELIKRNDEKNGKKIGIGLINIILTICLLLAVIGVVVIGWKMNTAKSDYSEQLLLTGKLNVELMTRLNNATYHLTNITDNIDLKVNPRVERPPVNVSIS